VILVSGPVLPRGLTGEKGVLEKSLGTRMAGACGRAKKNPKTLFFCALGIGLRKKGGARSGKRLHFF